MSFKGKPIKWPLTGKCSVFGGPNDTGVKPDEGLALVVDIHAPWCASYFLPHQPEGTTGSARRLNPDTLYCAMRWSYEQIPAHVLRDGYVIVTSKSGESIHVKPIDWGPNDRTDRAIDLSPGAITALKLQTDDIVTCQFVAIPERA